MAFPQHVRNLLSPHISNPVGIISRRSRALGALGTFRDIETKLEPYRAKWSESLPTDAPSRLINIPLLLLIARRCGYPDKDIIEDLACGMPIAGEIPDRSALRPRAKTATMTEKDWTQGIPARNKLTIDRVELFRRPELGTECRRKTLAEIKAGWLTEPVPLNDNIVATINLKPRCAIFEQHGNVHRKVRIADDLKAPGANSITKTRDTAAPDSLDVMFTHFVLPPY